MIKTINIIFFALMTFSSISAQSLSVTVKNIDTNLPGQIFVEVFDNEDDYTIIEKKLVGKKVKVEGEAAKTIQFENLPAGTYSVCVFHDKNNNGILDKNWVGMPLEGYAFSNNVFGIFGPPSFEDTNIKTTNGQKTKLSITMKY